MTNKKISKIKVSVVATFGSEWQEEVNSNSLFIFLNAWKTHMESTHKKNNAVILQEKI